MTLRLQIIGFLHFHLSFIIMKFLNIHRLFWNFGEKFGSSNCLLILYFELLPVSLRLSNIMGDNIVPFCFSLIFIVFKWSQCVRCRGDYFVWRFFDVTLNRGDIERPLWLTGVTIVVWTLLFSCLIGHLDVPFFLDEKDLCNYSPRICDWKIAV